MYTKGEEKVTFSTPQRIDSFELSAGRTQATASYFMDVKKGDNNITLMGKQTEHSRNALERLII